MKRFLGTTAILVALTGPVLAASHSANGIGSTTAQASDFFASDLIGMRIYNSETPVAESQTIASGAEAEWDDIGEINDILLDENGNVKAVILGVGGFLGVGERDVTVNMDTIKVVKGEGDADDRFLVVTVSKEMLEQAPEFDRDMDDVLDASDASTTMNADQTGNSGMAATSSDASISSDRPVLTPPTVEREGYATANMEEMQALTTEGLEGSYVYGANEETVGEIGSLVLGDSGQISQVVINVGGFLGIGEKPVAVTWDELQVIKNADGDDYRIYIDSSKEALEALPEYEG